MDNKKWIVELETPNVTQYMIKWLHERKCYPNGYNNEFCIDCTKDTVIALGREIINRFDNVHKFEYTNVHHYQPRPLSKIQDQFDKSEKKPNESSHYLEVDCNIDLRNEPHQFRGNGIIEERTILKIKHNNGKIHKVYIRDGCWKSTKWFMRMQFKRSRLSKLIFIDVKDRQWVITKHVILCDGKEKRIGFGGGQLFNFKNHNITITKLECPWEENGQHIACILHSAVIDIFNHHEFKKRKI